MLCSVLHCRRAQMSNAMLYTDSPEPQMFRASHTVVTIDTLKSEFTKMGFATWKCAECGIWKVPGQSVTHDPFCLLKRPQTRLLMQAWPAALCAAVLSSCHTGAPFAVSGEKAAFLGTCTLNDTSRLCCNCERQREQVSRPSKHA